MKPKDLKVGKKYFWFGHAQIDILRYNRYVYFDECCTYEFIVIASTSRYESFGMKTYLDLAAVRVTLPYDNLWQFCSLFFDFHQENVIYKLGIQ